MGAKPRMEPRKEYLENARTSFLFSTPAEYRECFGEMSEKYLTPATKGTRLGKKSFRVVVHLPNKHHNDRDNYLAKMKGNWIDRTFLDSNAPIPASRIRWDSPSNPGVHLIMHTERGKRVEYFLTPSKNYAKGTMVNGQITFPTMMRNKHTYKNGKSVWRRSEKLVACPVQLGFFGVSASKSGEFKLTYQKPVADCPKGLTQAGHAPPQFRKEWEPVEDKTGKTVVAEAEGTLVHMAEEHYRAFYEAQGMDYSQLLKLGSENMENAQQTERNYYDPSMAMVGDETLNGYTPSDSATVDLTSNQPTANYGAEGENATYAPSNEPDMVSSSSFDEPTNSTFNADGSCGCGGCSCMAAEGDSLNGYAPLDSIEEGAPIGHGVNQYFGSAEGTEQALLDESTTNITVEEGVSLEGFSGVDSVVVEAPLGHGVSQWYAEGDDPLPPAPADITGQDGPETEPSNENFSAPLFSRKSENNSCDVCQKDKPIVAHVEFDGPFLSALCKECYAEHLEMDGKPNVYGAEHNHWHNKKNGQFYGKWSKHRNNGQFKTHNAESFNDDCELCGKNRKVCDKEGCDEGWGNYDTSDGKNAESFNADEMFPCHLCDTEFDEDNWGGYIDAPHNTLVACKTCYEKTGAYMDAEHNHWHNKKNGQFYGKWSKHRNNGQFKTHNADTAGYLQNGSLSMDGYTPLESVDVDRTSYQPTQNYGAELEEPFKTGAYFGAGAWVGVGLLSAATMAALVLGAKIMEK